MKFLKHLRENLFITATGIAAFVHSTWALGTFFAGEQPEGWHLIGWLLPAALVAFALDVGQISTSIDIRERGLTLSRGATFIVFAVATYYLQFLYMAHHMPALVLSMGISEAHHDTALWLRDLAIWAIPALLPLSTLLYTFSGGEQIRAELPTITVEKPVETPLSAPKLPTVKTALLTAEIQHDPKIAYCTNCGWMKEYDNEDSARKGLMMHKRTHTTPTEPLEMTHEVKHADAE